MVAIRRQNGEEHSLDAKTKVTRPMVLAEKTKEHKDLLRLQTLGDYTLGTLGDAAGCL